MKLKILFLMIILIPKNQNEPMVTAIHLFSHVYEQLKVNNFLYFSSSKRPLHEKTENIPKPCPDSSLVFQSLTAKTASSE